MPETPIEYAETVTMDILFPGIVNWIEVSSDWLKEAAESYDPEFLRAPIVLDHKMEGPAYGHVLGLKYIEGETDKDEVALQATVGLFTSAKAMIESGEWNERSVFLDSYYPTPGIWYLRHLSLLGAANPAMPGMRLVVLPSMEEAEEVEASQMPDYYKQLIASALMAAWDKTDEHVRYRVRPVTSFRDNTFRTVVLSKKEGIKAVQGKLKAKYVPKGRDSNSMVNQAILFERDKAWDLTKAKRWIKKKQGKLSADIGEDESLIPAWGAALMGTAKPLPADDIVIIPGNIESASEQSAGVDTAVQKNQLVADATGGKSMDEDKEKDAKAKLEAEAKVKAEADAKAKAEVEAKIKELEAQIVELKGRSASEDVTLVEKESVDDLRKQNAELFAKNCALEENARSNEATLRTKLLADGQSKRLAICENAVDDLLADGYITPAQKNFGLSAALKHISDDALVDIEESGKTIQIKAVDVILGCLKMGGKLKLKGEFAKEDKALTGQASSNLEKLVASGRNVTDAKILARIEELQREDPKISYADAWAKAELEQGGAG